MRSLNGAGAEPQGAMFKTAVAGGRTVWRLDLDATPDGDADATLLVLGDIGLARRVAGLIETRGAAYPFARLPPDFFDADVVAFNLECCLSTRGAPWEPKPIVMRGRPEHLAVFPRGRARYVAGVANNHFLDCGESAAADTLDALYAHGMLAVGAKTPDGEAAQRTIETPGGTVALLAFAPSAHALPRGAAVNALPATDAAMTSAVAAARLRADVVVAMLHHGVEYSPYTARRARLTARRLVQAGADAVVAHHSHVMQAVERHAGGVILHGIGNFLLDVDLDRHPLAAHTLAVRLRLARGRLRSVQLEPFVLNREPRPEVPGAAQEEAMRARVERLSKLLRSRGGLRWNDARAFLIWSGGRLQAAADLARRHGAAATLDYYRRRLRAKLRAG